MRRTSSLRVISGGCVFRVQGASSSEHSAHVFKLILPLEATLEISVDGVRYSLPAERGMIVPSNCQQQVHSGPARVTIMLDPETLGAGLRSFAMGGVTVVLGGNLGRQLRDFALAVFDAPLEDRSSVEAVTAEALQILGSAGLGRTLQIDSRVHMAMELFRQPWLDLDHRAVSKRAGISPGHLSHLFSRQLGLSAKRYSLWVRTVAALEHMGRGATATATAMMSGFSDLAHFSRECRRHFGHPPSKLPMSCAQVFAGCYGSERSWLPSRSMCSSSVPSQA